MPSKTDKVGLLDDRMDVPTNHMANEMKHSPSKTKHHKKKGNKNSPPSPTTEEESSSQGATSYATSEEDVFETKEIVTEGDRQKVTYTRKVSFHSRKKGKTSHDMLVSPNYIVCSQRPTR